MRLPVFIKAIIGCTDTESSRYSLGGVRCESADNVSLITVTDGRKLLNVSYGDECDPVDCIIEAKPLTKAYAAASVKGRNTVFEVVDGKAMVVGGAGAARRLCSTASSPGGVTSSAIRRATSRSV